MEAHLFTGRRPVARWMPVALAALAGCGGFINEEPSVARVDIVEGRVSVPVGDSILLRALAYDQRDKVTLSSRIVIGWSIRAPAVARVDPASGWVVAQGVGQTVVTATARGVTDTVVVVVPPRAP